MKAMLLCALLATGTAAYAQNPTAISLSKAEAVREYPALGMPDSQFNKRYVQRLNSLKMGSDTLLLRDDWPEVLAKEIAIELGATPFESATAPTAPSATPQPTATPWKPLDTTLDPPHPAVAPTPDPEKAISKKYFVFGTVVHRSEDGLLIECRHTDEIGNQATTGEVWLTGKNATEGGTVRTAATKIGTYTYTPIYGGSRVLDEYEAQP